MIMKRDMIHFVEQVISMTFFSLAGRKCIFCISDVENASKLFHDGFIEIVD